MGVSLLMTAARRRAKRKKDKKPRPQSAMATAQRRFWSELGLSYDAMSDGEKAAAFERFAAFHVMRRLHAPDIAPSDIDEVFSETEAAAPSAADTGDRLTSLALIVGGSLVQNVDQIKARLDLASNGVKAELVAIRATRANRFDPRAIESFADAIAERLDGDLGPGATAEQGGLPGLLAELRARAEKLNLEHTLAVSAYFVSQGAWSEDKEAAPSMAAARQNLFEHPALDEADYEAVDRARLLDLIASAAPLPVVGGAGESESVLDVEDYDADLPLAGLVALPHIPGVDGGYVGHVPIDSFVTLLERPDGQGLREAIFHQNVRGFQGEGGVNDRIRRTLEGPEKAHFLLRNNGVTIVADSIDRRGSVVTLVNFQIVNGLQTSTVVYRLRDQLRGAKGVHVPVKLVAAEDWPLRRAIIEATNRQTPITGAAFYAACEKAVEIERYFRTRVSAGAPPLFLERRPGQYGRDVSLQKVSLEDLLRAFYAVFREAPQISERGFSAITGELDDDLLGASLGPEAYYVAARLLTAVREAAKRLDEPRLAQIEHHAAFGLRVYFAPDPSAIGNAQAMKDMCAKIEIALAAEQRAGRLDGLLMKMTESARQRMRSGVQGVPTLKRTKLSVERRARDARDAPPEAEIGRPRRADVA